MNELEKIRIWNTIKDKIKVIYDIKTRQIYYRAMLARAINEWGFNPENPSAKVDSVIELDDWEKDFVADIHDSIVFGIDVRKEARAREKQEALANMRGYIRKGGSLVELPDFAHDLYFEALHIEIENLCAGADYLIKGDENENVG